MKNDITFKQFLERSQSQLLEAAKKVPYQSVSYEINRYCKLPCTQNDNPESLNLKPSNKITVDWLFEDIEYPTPLYIRFNDQHTVYEPNWNKYKFQKWLMKNTKELKQI